MTNLSDAKKVRQKSERELSAEAPKQRQRKKAPQSDRMQSERFRQHNLSEKHIAMLRENVRKWREAHGGKVPTRKGVPDGWGSPTRRRLRAQIIERAKKMAEEVINRLVENGTLDKDGAGNAVLQDMVAIVLGVTDEGEPVHTVRDRIAAAKMVLDFTLPKPVAKSEVTVTAESFLQGLLGDQTK